MLSMHYPEIGTMMRKTWTIKLGFDTLQRDYHMVQVTDRSTTIPARP
jgi:hypothetical protein